MTDPTPPPDLDEVLKLCEASTTMPVGLQDMRRLANDLQWHAIRLAEEVERLRDIVTGYRRAQGDGEGGW